MDLREFIHFSVPRMRRLRYKLLNRQSVMAHKTSVLKCSLVVFSVLLSVLILAPFIFYCSHSIREFLIFRASTEVSPELSDPSLVGLTNTRAFFLPATDGVKLGTWHVLPSAAATHTEEESAGKKQQRFEHELSKDGSVVVIYFHGNTPSRSQGHRVKMYKLLSGLGCHVIAFDYRNFGDSSTAVMTEEGLTKDGLKVVDYVKLNTGKDTSIILWGHSLGTGISADVAATLCSVGRCPDGLVLHSGFTSIADAVIENIFAAPLRWTPWFGPFIRGGLSNSGYSFNTTQHLSGIHSPLLILHAEDDAVIPCHQSRELHKAALAHSQDLKREGVHLSAAGEPPLVTFVEFGADLHRGHNGIVDAPEMRSIARDFIQNCYEFQQETKRKVRQKPTR